MAKYTKDIWNRDKDGNKKEQRSFIRYAIVATALFLLFLFLKKDIRNSRILNLCSKLAVYSCAG